MLKNLRFAGVVVVTLVCMMSVVNVSAFEVTVTNMVGITSGTYNTVALPSKIKAVSDYTPLFRINISSNAYNSGESWTIECVTVTISNTQSFNPANDLFALNSGGLVLVADNANPAYLTSTNTWSGYSSETLVATSIYPTSWSGNGPWQVKLTPSSALAIDQANRHYTYYVCIKTTSTISNGDRFRAQIDDAGEVEVVVKENAVSSTVLVLQPTSGANGTIITADTSGPVIQPVNTPSPTTGTTPTVLNNDSFNIYTTSDVLPTNAGARTKLSLNISLGATETAAALSDSGLYNLTDLFTLDTSAIDGKVSNTLAVTDQGSGVFKLQYTITTTTVNAPTTQLPVRIKVRDAAGNESAWDETFYCIIDRGRPDVITLNSPAANTWIGDNAPVLSWQPSTDSNFSTYYLIFSTDSNLGDNAAGDGFRNVGNVLSFNWMSSVNWTNGFPVSSTTTVYYWGVVAADKAGNIGQFVTGREFKYDSIVPNIYNEGPKNSTTSTTPTITVSFDDSLGGVVMSGINFSTVTLTLNDQVVTFSTNAVDGSTTTISYVPAQPLVEGSYTAKVWVIDNAGKTAQLSWGFTVDTVKPVVLDTDNDSYSDYQEMYSGKNPNDETSVPSTSVDFSPVNNECVKASFVSSGQKIKFRVDDPYGLVGIDTTTTASSIKLNYITKGTTESFSTFVTVAKTSYTIFEIQPMKTLLSNGIDDGEIQYTCTPVDKAGNVGSTFTRKFIYDTTPPVISTVTAPSTGDTTSRLTFAIDLYDRFGISLSTMDIVQLTIYNSSEGGYMSLVDGTTSRFTITINTLNAPKTYYYYFMAKDKAGNSCYFPPNANTDQSTALPLVITDKTAPEVAIYQIETLLNYSLGSGTTWLYTQSGTGNTNVKSIPVLYSNPLAFTTGYYNVIRATASPDTSNVVFELKLSTDTVWSSALFNVVKSYKTISGNPMWEAYINTSSLGNNLNYDIRVKAYDTLGNSNIPLDNSHQAYVKVLIKPALAPVSTMHTFSVYSWFISSRASGKTLLLNASPNTTTGNIDIVSCTFQYKKNSDPATAWTDLYKDTNTLGTDKRYVELSFNENDLLYMNINDSLAINSVAAVKFVCTTVANTYDTFLTRGSDGVWKTVLALPPNTYDYYFQVTDNNGKQYNVRDVKEFTSGGATTSRLYIKDYSYIWNIAGLENNVTYDVRVIAADSKGNTDPAATNVFSFTYDNTAPVAPVLTAPVAGQRIKDSSTYNLFATVYDSDIMSVFFHYSDDNGVTWKNIGQDTNGSAGWTTAWSVPDLYTDTNYLLKVSAIDKTRNITFSTSTVITITIDATAPKFVSFWVEASSVTTIMYPNIEYTLKMTTLDNDIAIASVTATSGLTGICSPSYDNGKNGHMIIASGNGTAESPYMYTAKFVPSNTDNISGSFTAYLTDKAGNVTNTSISVMYYDNAPSASIITQVNIDNDGDGKLNENTTAGDTDADGLLGEDGIDYYTSGTLMYVGRFGAQVVSAVTNVDGGTVKFQYSTSGTGPWVTFNEIASAATVTANWNPLALGLVEGTYYLRTVVIDNENNVEVNPAVVTVLYDAVEPSVSQFIAPTGTIDCSQTYSLTGKTNDSDVVRMFFQYKEPSTNTWTPVDITATRLVRLVNSSLTPNTFSAPEVAIVVTSPNTTQASSMEVRAVVYDRAGNRNTDAAHAPVAVLSLNDTISPVAVLSYYTGAIQAECGDANIKSVAFQYKLNGSTNPWVTLWIDSVADGTWTGLVGSIWSSGLSLAILPNGLYDIRAIATDMFNNSNPASAPVSSILAETSATGSRVYTTKKSQVMTVGVKSITSTNSGGCKIDLEVKTTVALAAAPTASFLFKDNANSQSKAVTLTDAGNNVFTGTLELDSISATAGFAANVRIAVFGITQSGEAIGENASIGVSVNNSNSPTVTLIDNTFTITVNASMPRNVTIVAGPAVTNPVPTAQAAMLTPIQGRTYSAFVTDNNQPVTNTGTQFQCTINYSDADIPQGVSEEDLGIVFWDEVSNKWSATGINTVKTNKYTNSVSFNSTHLSKFALMAIKAVPEITFISPVSNGYSDEDPVINVMAVDPLSGISSFRIIVDGTDITAVLIARSASDGIDNDGNGLIDETPMIQGFTPEAPFTLLSETGTRFLARAALKLSPGTHTLEVIAFNQQARSSSQKITFTVTNQLDILSVYNYPNPFNPSKENTTVKMVLTNDAKVTVKVYDFAGKLVSTIMKNETVYANSGATFSWGGTSDITGKYLANDAYFMKIEATDGAKTVVKTLKLAVLR
ncbi:MAG: Ig-like domain repeat protein [Elusimicrobiota bacterium]